jgi:hypothetical protein
MQVLVISGTGGWSIPGRGEGRTIWGVPATAFAVDSDHRLGEIDHAAAAVELDGRLLRITVASLGEPRRSRSVDSDRPMWSA